MCGCVCVCFIQILCVRSSAPYNVGLALRPLSVMDTEGDENRDRNIDRRGRRWRTQWENMKTLLKGGKGLTGHLFSGLKQSYYLNHAFQSLVECLTVDISVRALWFYVLSSKTQWSSCYLKTFACWNQIKFPASFQALFYLRSWKKVLASLELFQKMRHFSQKSVAITNVLVYTCWFKCIGTTQKSRRRKTIFT